VPANFGLRYLGEKIFLSFEGHSVKAINNKIWQHGLDGHARFLRIEKEPVIHSEWCTPSRRGVPDR